jgi:hypothetical protein
MFIHGLWKIAGNDGRFLTGVEIVFHNASGRHWAVRGQMEGADMRRPTRVFLVGNPTAASRMGEVGGKVGLRKCVRWRRCVDGFIMYCISPVAQCVRKSPVVG